MMCRCTPLHGSGYGHMADGIGPEQAVRRTACSPDLLRSTGLGDGGPWVVKITGDCRLGLYIAHRIGGQPQYPSRYPGGTAMVLAARLRLPGACSPRRTASDAGPGPHATRRMQCGRPRVNPHPRPVGAMPRLPLTSY
jgi:hypothetical protein